MNALEITNHHVIGTVPDDWHRTLVLREPYWAVGSTLDLSNNWLSGTLPPFLVANESVIYSLRLYNNTHLVGNLPQLNFTRHFNLSGTSLDMCLSTAKPDAPSWLPLSSTRQCAFPSSDTVCRCPDFWNTSQCATATTTCPPSPPSPLLPPTSPPTPNFQCPMFPRKPPPPPAVLLVSGPTTIEGDLILPPNSTIVFSELATLTVTGCISASQITVEVDDNQIGKGDVMFNAISSGSGLCNIGDDVPAVKVTQKDSSCKKVKARAKMESTNLNFFLTVDLSRCRLWWIITIPVVVGCIIILALAVGLFMKFRPTKLDRAAEMDSHTSVSSNPMYETDFRENPM